MLVFGLLKFLDPFKSWYGVQITKSGLGELSYAMGIIGEIAVGATLVLCLLYRARLSQTQFSILTIFSYSTICVMMLVGIYVHLHPDVPGEVLPLKIKPPYIPLFFLLLALTHALLTAGKIRSKLENKS